MNKAAILGSAAALLAVMGAPVQAQDFKPALETSDRTAREAAASQQRIDQLDEQTTSLLNDYRAVLKELETARRYNATQRRNIEAQESEISRLREDIANIEGLQRAILPLMEDMIARFGELVAADMPFMISDRTQRAVRLAGVLDDPDLSAAQQYRLIVEAYQIENEFGRTMKAYNGTIGEGEEALIGQFLQVGRVALIFKTEDDSVLRVYDKAVGEFVDLERSYLPDVKLGLRIAKEQTAPSVFFVPVKAPGQ